MPKAALPTGQVVQFTLASSTTADDGTVTEIDSTPVTVEATAAEVEQVRAVYDRGLLEDEATAELAASEGEAVEQDEPSPLAKRLADAMRAAAEAVIEEETAEGETAETVETSEEEVETAVEEPVVASAGPVSETLTASATPEALVAERAALVAAGRAVSDANEESDPERATATAAETAELQVMIDPANPGRFRSVMVVEEERTADDRMIARGAVSWRPTPLPLMLMTTNAPGHDGSMISATFETIQRKGTAIVGEGRFDTGDAGLEAARLVANKVLNQVSIDGGDVEVEYVVEEEDEDGFPTKVLARITQITVLGATIVPFPAIGSTVIEWVAPDAQASADDLDEFLIRAIPGFTVENAVDTATADGECTDCDEAETLAAAGPRSFPQAMFADPQLAEPTPVHVTPDGHVLGHLALWGTCHTSFKACVTPPRSKTGYQHYLVGTLPLEEGGYQPVGTITLDAMHADHRLKAREAAMHYDHTGKAAAYVNVGEDDHGIWVSGVLHPGLSEELATTLCGASLSGDWRNIGGNLELVAVLGVNVPGFPVAHQKNDQQLSLVAAGYGPDRARRPIPEMYGAAMEALSRKAVAAVDELRGELAVLRGEVAETKADYAELEEQVTPLLMEEYARRLRSS